MHLFLYLDKRKYCNSNSPNPQYSPLLTSGGYIYTHTHVHTHIHIYLFIYLYIYINMFMPSCFQVRCVHDDYVEDCGKGSVVWFYKGFPVSQSVSVWRTKPAATALGGSFLYANHQVDSPPGIQFRCLKKSAYVVQ